MEVPRAARAAAWAAGAARAAAWAAGAARAAPAPAACSARRASSPVGSQGSRSARVATTASPVAARRSRADRRRRQMQKAQQIALAIAVFAAGLIGCGDGAVGSPEDAKLAYMGLDASIDKAIQLGFDGFNS